MADSVAAWHHEPMTQVGLIVAADEPAIFFVSLEDAERWMEPIDVKDGVYSAAFGPAGEPYAISTDGKYVNIRRTGDAARPEALKELLLCYFGSIGEATSDNASLPALLARCSPSYK